MFLFPCYAGVVVTKKNRLVLELLTLALACAPLVIPTTASAIPAFSRQHKTECSTCHTIYPELNEFGDAFLKNGYVYPSGAKQADAGTKPQGQGQGKTEGLWLSGIPEDVPISFTGTLDVRFDDDAVDEIDLSSRSLRLHAGGAFREAAGFFATYNAYAQGVQAGTDLVPSNNATNINEMYIMLRRALGTPVNVKVGRMEPKTSLWKRSNRIILVPSYASTAYNVGSSEFSLDTPQDALEVNGVFAKRLFAAAGLVDSKGQDNNDGYGHVSVKIGGTDFNGHEPEIDLEEDSVWDYLSLTLGAFGYVGKNSNLTLAGVPQNTNNFYRAGGEFDLLYKRFHLKGSGVFGRDKNPTFSPTPGAELETHAYAFEGEYMLGVPVNTVALFRYEYQEDARGGTRRYIPAIAYAPIQNTRLSLQYVYADTPAGSDRFTLASVAFSF